MLVLVTWVLYSVIDSCIMKKWDLIQGLSRGRIILSAGFLLVFQMYPGLNEKKDKDIVHTLSTPLGSRHFLIRKET